MSPDTMLDCVDCNAPFTFTESEAKYYADRGLTTPKRCGSCRTKRRRDKEAGAAPQFHDAVCTKCAAPCSVPFVPREGRPVYCQTCFKQQQNPRG